MSYIYTKYKYSNKIKLLRMVAVLAVTIVCFCVGSSRIFAHNPNAGDGFGAFGWFVLIIGGVLVIVVGYLEIYKQLEIGRLYPIIAITLGIIFVVMVPAFETPDEKTHYNTVYDVSDGYLGEDTMYLPDIDETGKLYWVRNVRVADADFPESTNVVRIDTSQYDAYIDSLASTTELEDTMTMARWNMSDDGRIMYYLPAVGVALARIAGLNFGWLYAFGVLLNMLFYVAMTTYAINKIPVGKRVLFVISLLPITLQQVSSLSYDCGVMACCMVVIAQAFFLKYGNRNTRYNWKWNIEIPIIRTSITELIMYVFCGFLLLNVKRGVFLLIFLLPIALCVNKNWFQGKAKYFTWSAIALVVIGIVVFLLFLGGYNRIVAFIYAVPQNIRGDAGINGVAPIEYIHNPGRLFGLIGNLIKEETTHLFNQLGGGALGNFRIFMTKKIVAFNLLLLLLSMIRYNKENDDFKAGNRIITFLIGLAPVIITFTAMLLYWTYPWNTKVEGFQARYAIPTLSVMMLAVGRWKKIRIPNVDNLFVILMTISSYLGCISILGFI